MFLGVFGPGNTSRRIFGYKNGKCSTGDQTVSSRVCGNQNRYSKPNKEVSEPKPSGCCAQTRSEQDATSRNVCVFGFAETYFANTYSGDCVVFQEVTAA